MCSAATISSARDHRRRRGTIPRWHAANCGRSTTARCLIRTIPRPDALTPSRAFSTGNASGRQPGSLNSPRERGGVARDLRWVCGDKYRRPNRKEHCSHQALRPRARIRLWRLWTLRLMGANPLDCCVLISGREIERVTALRAPPVPEVPPIIQGSGCRGTA